MNKKKKYIEFVGPHTAGKTSVIHEIVDNDLLSPQVVIYPQKIKRSNMNFLIALPVIALRNLKHILFMMHFLFCYSEWNFINYHSAWRHLFKMLLLHPYYSRYEFDILMKDDMLHLLPRIQFRKKVDINEIFTKFFNHFSYLYDALVFIDLPYNIMNERFTNRFKNRDKKRRESRIPVYERVFQQNKDLKSVLTTQSRVPVLLLNGTDEVRYNAEKVIDFIKNTL